ncbi:MAG: hypothetical protein EOO50_14595 [Flavobacterium sp.]|uniref:hypothetical protein n=1 Tax=Flavobacterium sp. TaxID=239 RepID=UPI001205C07B|nr:hypothetical protein [Flavobacterium sp.]RZJ65253.1 MAG: hypothetical protein EOO50_14595 [Flavobacterium sp.]
MKNIPAIIVLSKAMIVLGLGIAFYFADEEGSAALIVIGCGLIVAAILLFLLLPAKKGKQNYF